MIIAPKFTDVPKAKYTTEIVLQNFNSTFQILGSKNNEDGGEKFSARKLVDDAENNFAKKSINVESGAYDYDDEIPF